MISVVNTRASLQQWVRRKGYMYGGDTGYPAKHLCHEVVDDTDVYLQVYLKALSADLFQTSLQADDKDKKPTASIVINKVNGIDSSAAEIAEEQEHDAHCAPNGYVEAPGSRGLALPPSWRFVNGTAAVEAAMPDVD